MPSFSEAPIIKMLVCLVIPHKFLNLSLHVFSFFALPAGFPGGTVVKNPPANAIDARDTGSISGSGRSPGRGHGNPLQYSYLENPVDRG